MVSTRRKHYHDAVSRNTSKVNLLDLPEEILLKIWSYLEFGTIAEIRPVSLE